VRNKKYLAACCGVFYYLPEDSRLIRAFNQVPWRYAPLESAIENNLITLRFFGNSWDSHAQGFRRYSGIRRFWLYAITESCDYYFTVHLNIETFEDFHFFTRIFEEEIYLEDIGMRTYFLSNDPREIERIAHSRFNQYWIRSLNDVHWTPHNPSQHVVNMMNRLDVDFLITWFIVVRRVGASWYSVWLDI